MVGAGSPDSGELCHPLISADLLSVAPSERVIIKCPECGERRTLTVRQARRAGQCPFCRYPLKIEVTERYRNYWLERFSMTEIKVLASSVFDDIPDRSPALVASHHPNQGNDRK